MELEVYEGVGQVRRVPLPDGAKLTVGRVKTCDVVLGGNGVSRHHCTITRAGDVVTIENHSSTKGGTKVAGETVESTATLSPGVEVGVGDGGVLILRAAPAAEPEKKERRPKAIAREPDPLRDTAPDDAAQPEPAAPAPRPGSGRAKKEAAPADDEEPLTAKEQARAFARRKRLENTVRTAATLLLLGILAGGGSVVAMKLARSMKTGPDAATERGPAPAAGATEAPGQGPTPDRTWAALLKLPPDQLPLGLEAFAQRFPDDPRAPAAALFAARLQETPDPAPAGGKAAAKPAPAGAAADALRAAAAKVKAAGDLSRAAAILDLVAAAAPGTAQATAAAGEREALKTEAQDALEALQAEGRQTAQQLGPVRALTLVLDKRAKLRGLGVDEPLDELVAGLEEEAAKLLAARRGPAIERSERATTVEKEGVDLALRFDFEGAWGKLDELLGLGLEDEERLRAHWLRHQVRALHDAFEALKAAAAGPAEGRPRCTLAGDLQARLKQADGKQAVLEPVVVKGAGELTWPWTRFTPAQQQQLLAVLPPDDHRLALARAFHALRTGLEDEATAVLLPWAAKKRFQAETFSFYALAAGVPMPEGGFVIFEGRLVAPAERDRVLAERRQAKEAAEQLAREAKEASEERRLAALVQRICALLDLGSYEAGRAALAKVVEKHGGVPGVGDVARARLESPILRRRDVRLSKGLGRNGPSANRLDIDLVGDGFVLDDQKQVQFDRYADSAVKFCQLQDFFKEYDAYINYWACNAVSKDEGLTKGTEAKDTALRGRIEEGTYTIPDRGNAFSLLERIAPGQHDRLVVGIGNDFANVATGGGGVVACAKTMLSAVPHELGHAFGGLGDEYDFSPTGGPAPPAAAGHVPARPIGINLMEGNRRDELLKAAPWLAWLDPTGEKNWTGKPIDLFEGGDRRPKDVWRPQRACVMRDVGSPFCAVCMEQMVLRLHDRVRPIDRTWPEQTELTMDEAVTFRVLVMKPRTHDLFVHWRRKRLGPAPAAEPPPGASTEDEDPDATKVRPGGATGGKEKEEPAKDISGKLTTDGVSFIHYITLRPKELGPGRHEVSAEVWDPTPWVLEANREKLRQTHRWVVTVPPKQQ